MTSSYKIKLEFTIWKTSIKAQNIDNLQLKTYNMKLAGFLLQDSLGKVWFFKKTFFLADISMKAIVEMLFLFLDNINIKFTEKSEKVI